MSDDSFADWLPRATFLELLALPFDSLRRSPEDWQAVVTELQQRKWSRRKILIVHLLIATPALAWPVFHAENAPSKLFWGLRWVVSIGVGVGLSVAANLALNATGLKHLASIGSLSMATIYFGSLTLLGWEAGKPWRHKHL